MMPLTSSLYYKSNFSGGRTMYGYIYITTNLINGKKYIGQHHSEEFDPEYKGSGKILWNAINKYGWDNFKTKILVECDSQEELDKEEIRLIKENNAVESEDFYNLQAGGYNLGNLRGSKLSEDTRRKLSESHKGKPCPESTKQKLQEIMKGNKNAAGPMSEDTYKKHVERCRERSKDPKFRKILSDAQYKRYENPESHKILSEAHSGKPSNTKGKIHITNGITNSMVNNENEIPEGWYKGRTMREGFSELVSKNHADMSGSNNPCYGKIAINNGCYNKFIYESELDSYLQEGFVKGLLRKSSSSN